MNKATLLEYRGSVLEWQQSATYITFRLRNHPLHFYLYKEDCVQRYSKCLHWITQEYPVAIFCISAWINTTNPVAAVVDRITPLRFNVYSFFFDTLRDIEIYA